MSRGPNLGRNSEGRTERISIGGTRHFDHPLSDAMSRRLSYAQHVRIKDHSSVNLWSKYKVVFCTHQTSRGQPEGGKSRTTQDKVRAASVDARVDGGA